jgi:hypothetical protein
MIEIFKTEKDKKIHYILLQDSLNPIYKLQLG